MSIYFTSKRRGAAPLLPTLETRSDNAIPGLKTNREPHKQKGREIRALSSNHSDRYAFAGFSPRVNPGAGRNSGRTTLGSALGAACGGCGGGGRVFSGRGVPFATRSA